MLQTQRRMARKTKVVGSLSCAPGAVQRRVSSTSQLGGIKSVRRDAAVSMTSPQPRRPLQLTVNPVRQCARRGAVDPGVAQASPLFSDHAPREVHLWQ